MQPFREPLRSTLVRNAVLAIVLGFVLSQTKVLRAGWLMATLIMLWPTLGGHGVEIFFLNVLGPRISPLRAVQVPARITVWFLGGAILAGGIRLSSHSQWPAWWTGGLGLIAIELAAHLLLQLRGRPSFYNGRG